MPKDLNTQAHYLDSDTMCWDEVEELYVHISGMYIDPGAKAYYTFIDQNGRDLRPLYYIQPDRDFSLAVNGKLRQSNKIVLEDKSWDRKAIYNVKS